MKRATLHDLATIAGFAERTKRQAELEADRLDPRREVLLRSRPAGDTDEEHLVRHLDALSRQAQDVTTAARLTIERRQAGSGRAESSRTG